MRWYRLALLLLSLTVVALPLAVTAASPRTASQSSVVRQFTLYVRDGWLPLPDGGQVYVWGFTEDPNGPPRVPGPAIVVDEGDTVEITLVNDRDPTASALRPAGEGHTIHLHGLDVSTEHDGVPETHPAGLARQGDSFTYRFVAAHAGTYFYHCHQNNVEHQQLGLYGSLVVRAAGGARTAYTGGPAYDREYTLVLAEMAAAGHEQARRAAQEGDPPYNWLRYQPDYFFLNDAIHATADTPLQLAAAAGERVLVRVVNAGYLAHAIQAPGAPVQVVATDGRPWPTGPTTDEIWLGPGERYDLLVTAGAEGVSLRDHAAPAYVAPRPAAAPPAAITGAAARTITLYAREASLTMPDGAELSVWGFAETPEGAARVPGPALVATEGEVLEITVAAAEGTVGPVSALAVPGLPLERLAAATDSDSPRYRLLAERAGTYLYAAGGVEARQMGLYGALVVRPAGAPAGAGAAPAADHEYTMVVSEMDAPGHAQTRRAVREGAAAYDWAGYAPNYFLINGRAYPDTEADPASAVHAEPGQRVLIRVVNAGQHAHAMHLHGYHFQVAAKNGRPWPDGPLKDTVLLGPDETVELLFVADQAGLFPFHDHFETANTNDGVWLGGMHTMVATGVAHHAASPRPAAPAAPAAGSVATVFVRDNFYAPNQATVPVGAAVTWQHDGQVEHTVSNLLNHFDSGPLQPGDVFSYTFTTPGRYDYFCRFHITNRGTITVQ
jgi:manganese oxidase